MFDDSRSHTDSFELLTVKETAELTKSTTNSIYVYISRNGVREGKVRKRFPKSIYIKVGRKVLFIKSK